MKSATETSTRRDSPSAPSKTAERRGQKPQEPRTDHQPTQDPLDPGDPRTLERRNEDLKGNPVQRPIGMAPIDYSKADAARAEQEKAERERLAKQADKSLASTETSADRDALKEKDGKPAKITVTFTGDPKGGLDPIAPEYGGKTFEKGKAVVIEDAAWIKTHGHNLRKNNHFRVE